MNDAMPDSPGPARSAAVRSALVRGAAFLAIWVVLIGAAPPDLAVGAVAAALATWASLRLLPPGSASIRLLALVGYAPHFLWQSLVAGADVARRAFDPRLPIRPGFVRYRTALPPGNARNAFASITSLLPGTVPAGENAGSILYHCLDVGEPVAEQLAAEETRLAGALGRTRSQ